MSCPTLPQIGERRHLARRIADRLHETPLSDALRDLRAILENATVGILFSKNRVLVQANPQFVQMFGFDSIEEVIGLPGAALYPSQEAYEALGQKAGPLLAAGQPFRGEIEMRKKDGTLFWCRLSAKAVNPQRTQEGTIWIMEDVTAERATAERLQRALADQETIFNNAAVGIMYVRERVIARANRKLEEIFGYGPGEMTGRSAREFHVSEESFLRLGELARQTLWRDETFTTEWPARRKDGSTFWVRLTGHREAGAGERFDVVWIFEDITEQRRVQEELQRIHLELEQRVIERPAELSAANAKLQD
ncbi:MAG: PAS domain S-box protein, partial [Rhodocyclaceae bacterium]|nr:PAS domain S-box protein [Rhodocyclaceae bacterium]